MSDGTTNTGATGTGNTDPNGGQGQNGNGGQGGKIEYTPEQQSHMEGLMNKNHADAMTKAEAKYSGKVSELMVQIQTLKIDLEAKVKGADENKDKGKGVDLTALTDKIDGMEKKLEESRKQAAMGNIKSAAADMGAINSDQVSVLIMPFVKIEDGKTSVLNTEGQVRKNGEGQDVSVKELVKEFLEANPHLAKASGGSGAGSKGAEFDGSGKEKTITRSDFSKLHPTEQKKIATGRTVAIID